METLWITHAEAKALVGCSKHVIERAAYDGHIERRHCLAKQTPTLNRASVVAFGEQWRAEQIEAAEQADRAKRERLRAETARPPAGPPADGDVWLNTYTASLVIGIRPQSLARLARQGRIPATADQRVRQMWFRRRDVEQYAAVRAFARQFAARSHCLSSSAAQNEEPPANAGQPSSNR